MSIALTATTAAPTKPADRPAVTPKHRTRELPTPTKRVEPGSTTGRVIASSCPSQSNMILLGSHFTNRSNC